MGHSTITLNLKSNVKRSIIHIFFSNIITFKLNHIFSPEQK